MGKINNIWSYLARHKYLITIIIGVLIVGVVDENSFRKYAILRMRQNELQQEYDAYHKQYERDSLRLRALEASRQGVERIARERYFMKRPNEDIFVLSTDQRIDDDADNKKD